MDGGAGGALVVGLAAAGAFVRFVIRVDRYERRHVRHSPQLVRMVPRSPLLAEPAPRRPDPEPQDERPARVEVPDRLLVRAARLVAGEQYADAGLLERGMPVIPAMAARLMAALEGVGIVGPRADDGRARVLVTPRDLPGVFERWGIVEDQAPR